MNPIHAIKPTALSALLLIAATTSSQAAEFCAATGEQLASALAAADSNNQDDIIRVTVGVKTRPGLADDVTRWMYWGAGTDADNDLQIIGGWTSGCASPTDQNLTTLDAELGGAVMSIDLPDNSTGMITVSNLTLVRGYVDTYGAVSSLHVDTGVAGSSLVTLERLRIRNSGSYGDSGSNMRVRTDGGTLTVRNVLIHQNTTYSGASLMASVSSGATINLSNNTVTANNDTEGSSAGPVGGVSIFGTGTINVINNVFWGNTSANATDLAVQQNFGSLINNHIGALRGTPASNSNRTQGNPLFIADGSGIPTPSLGSPLRDSGFVLIPGGQCALDVRGLDRVTGERIDRGATEFDDLFSAGFE